MANSLGFGRLDDRVYWVVGAAPGMGAAAASALSAAGARLVVLDRVADIAMRLADDVGGLGVPADVTDEREVIAAVRTTLDELGRLDGVVDVVGGAEFRALADLEDEFWTRQFDLNLRHAVLIGRHVGQHLATVGSGSLVFYSTNASLFGSRAYPAYSAAKSALNSWVRSLAEELGPSGVRANAVAPGPTLTPRLRAARTDDELAELAALAPLNRLGRPEDMAAVVQFLLSDAARHVTGQTIVVDGGMTVRDPVFGHTDHGT